MGHGNDDDEGDGGQNLWVGSGGSDGDGDDDDDDQNLWVGSGGALLSS